VAIAFCGTHNQCYFFTAQLVEKSFSNQPFPFRAKQPGKKDANLPWSGILLREGGQWT
jgi:hypothetical protein